MDELLKQILACKLCAAHLLLGPSPVVQLHPLSKILIIGQAPGKRVHETGIPWNDASGKKLREWMGINEADFYDPSFVSIMPMGFCYPGKSVSGDLPPRKECAPLWHRAILQSMQTIPLILLVGQYSQRHYLTKRFYGSLTDTVKHYKEFLPQYFPLPHPSPRNQHWLKVNPWFGTEAIPELQKAVKIKLRERRAFAKLEAT